ncbi:MAG: Ig-like domain-containing protein, partial [Mycobacterium sp.]|nr:Ig-like domain-containing protein [Mycobacterium sp.]
SPIGTATTDSAGHFVVQITDTSTLQDGQVTIGIQATDASGTQGNIALFTYTLITATPTAPTGITLDPTQPSPGGSDSGVVGDNITNVTAPYFDVAGIENANTSGVIAAAAPFEVFLYRSTSPSGPWTLVNQEIDPTLNPTTQFDTVTIQDPGPLTGSAAGINYYYYATQQDIAGNTSPASSPVFQITVKTSAQTPTGLKLDPNNPAGGSDTGSSNTDDITNDKTPFLNVSSIEATATSVILLASFNGGAFKVVNTESPVVFNTDGSVTIQDPVPAQPDGTYTFEVKQVDVAGNTSAASAPLQVLIVTATPVIPTLALDSGSDSGTKGDGITNVTDPSIDLTGLATTPPFPQDGPYTVTLLRATSASGPFVAVPYTVVSGAGTSAPVINDAGPLQPDGNYYYKVETTDVAGNFSLSQALHILVVTATPATPTVALDAGSDSGVKGDDITNVTSPSLDLTGLATTPPFPADGPYTVTLLRSFNGGPFVAVPYTVVSGAGTSSPVINDAGPLQPDGTYSYEVKTTDVAGNSSLSTALSILVVTSTPAVPTLALDAASDSGVHGDDITSVTDPSIDLAGLATTPPFP